MARERAQCSLLDVRITLISYVNERHGAIVKQTLADLYEKRTVFQVKHTNDNMNLIHFIR